MTQITSSNDLLGFLVSQVNTGNKNWFGFLEQRITGINLAHEIAARHADKMSPAEVAAYVVELNDQMHKQIIKKEVFK
jgi:predicted ATPase